MAQQNRVTLKSYFLTGSKPTQSQFGELIDSVVNIKEEGILANGTGNTVLSAGITIANSALDTPGSIRWNGTNFQFRDGSGWHDMSLGGGGSQWTTIGSNINLAAGNAGIGVAAGPTYKLEVNLNNSTGPANPGDSVRLGNATFFMDAFNAYFSHRNMAATTNYAMAQDTFGNVTINTAASRSISFMHAGVLQASIAAGVFTIGTNPLNTTTLLVVNGDAAKPGGGQFKNGSDRRVKKDISPFNDGLDLLKQLKPVNYRYNGKAGYATDARYVGLIAQEVQDVFPYMVGTMKVRMEPTDEQETDMMTVDASALTYVMVNSLKELDARLARLEAVEQVTMMS